MGSSQFEGLEKIGIQRGGGAEPCHGPPGAFTVIGLDISAERLISLYPETNGKLGEAHMRAVALIRGVRDRTRTSKPPPPEFVAAVGAAGVVQRILVANLGPDKKGKPWVITVAGRQRNWATRLHNEKADPADVREVIAELRGFPNRAGIDAELAALETNAASNVFVAMSQSQMADHAVMLREKGIAPANIAIRVGAKNASHVALLFALAECGPEVQAAADADEIALAECVALAKLDLEEQARRVLRKKAGPTKKEKDAAAPPRPKTPPAARIVALRDAFTKTVPQASFSRAEVLALLAFLTGQANALDAHEALKAAWEESAK